MFDKEFNQELRARNSVNHHRRFEDLAIDRVFLKESLSDFDAVKEWEREHIAEYRKLANEWVQRVQRRGANMDEFLELVAEVTLANCRFLSDCLTVDEQPSSKLNPK